MTSNSTRDAPHDARNQVVSYEHACSTLPPKVSYCRWSCIAGILYCFDPKHFALPAVHSILEDGTEWEAGCKRMMLSRWRERMNGTVVVAAGLFYGDYLHTMTQLAGPMGLVYGFEPTSTVKLARATAAANHLGARIVQACLSNTTAEVASMCGFGGQAQIASVGERRFRDCAHSWTPVTCTTLDRALPWPTRPVAMLQLDLAGHEAPALQGAMKLIDRWRPVLATAFSIKKPLIDRLRASGYSRVGECDVRGSYAGTGLRFYSADPRDLVEWTEISRKQAARRRLIKAMKERQRLAGRARAKRASAFHEVPRQTRGAEQQQEVDFIRTGKHIARLQLLRHLFDGNATGGTPSLQEDLIA